MALALDQANSLSSKKPKPSKYPHVCEEQRESVNKRRKKQDMGTDHRSSAKNSK